MVENETFLKRLNDNINKNLSQLTASERSVSVYENSEKVVFEHVIEQA